MCGIIGILGHNEVSPQLVDGLRRLEWRQMVSRAALFV